MLLLSHAGCQLFLWLGLVESAGCEEWLRAEESASSFGWFKLLFVPTLGLLILTLFMLEERCQGHAQHEARRCRQQHAQDALDAQHTAGHRSALPGAYWGTDAVDLLDPAAAKRRSRSGSSASSIHSHTHYDSCCTHGSDKSDVYHLSYSTSSSSSRHSSSSSASRPVSFTLSSTPPSASPSFPRVLLISESGQPTAYTLPPSLPLRDLILFHAARHNLTLDPVLAYVDGHLVDGARMADAVERVGVGDGSVVRLEMDWKRMVEVLMKEQEREAKEMERELARVRRERVEKTERSGKMEAELSAVVADEQRAAAAFEQATAEREADARLLLSAEQRLSQAIAARAAAEDERRQREHESGSEREKREKARLQQLIAATKKETIELSRERGELSQKTRRVREENEELQARRREVDVKGDRIEREKEGWRRKVEGGEKAVVERLERAEKEREDSGRMKAAMESSEREKDEKRQQKDEHHRAIVQRIDQLDHAIAKQTARLKAAEKDAADSVKYRQLAKQYEADLKESARWKLLVKQGRVREKLLEKETKELVHWRQRAKAFEREVRQLRNWRREVGRRERRAAGVDEQSWAMGMAGAGFEYGEGAMDGLGGYDGIDDWTADSGGGALSDEMQSLTGTDAGEDEAAIPPVDVMSSQALSLSSASSSSLASASRASAFAVSGSTLQPTAAPFVPRLNLPLSHAAPPAPSNFAPPSLYAGWAAGGGSATGGLHIIDDRATAAALTSSLSSSLPFALGSATEDSGDELSSRGRRALDALVKNGGSHTGSGSESVVAR